MNANDFTGGEYLKKEDVPKQTLCRVTACKSVKLEDEPRLALYFRELDKALLMNKTNINRVVLEYGAETDDWIGKELVVYVDPEVEFAGKVVGGLRVRPPRRDRAQKETPPPSDWQEEAVEDGVPF